MHQTYWRRPSNVYVSLNEQKKSDTMSITKLNRVIKRFWSNEDHNDIYPRGVCSEFAVALKRYLNAGTIYKASIMHTFLKYKDHYCDIRGCYTPNEYQTVVPSLSYTPATKSELDHINNLLEQSTVTHIIKGLKKAEKEIK